MRVLILHEDTRAPGQGGGAESMLRDQTEVLRQLGHEVCWLHSPDIERTVDDWKPDIVQVQTIHNLVGFAPVLWLQRQQIPHVWALMDYWPFCSGRMLLVGDQGCEAVTGACQHSCHQFAPAHWRRIVNGSPVVALNEYTAAIYRRNGLRCDYVVELGVDTDLFRPNHSQRNGERAVYTSCAWPTQPTKGMHVLRKALTGTGLRSYLATGLSREDLAGVLRRAEVYVFPSCYEETFGLSLTEAMASGCACVASDVAGARAQVEDGATGLLVPPRDADALRAALLALWSDDRQRRWLGEAARAHVEVEHSLLAMGRRWEAVYGSLLGSREAVGGHAAVGIG